jgi:hypothetical protein
MTLHSLNLSLLFCRVVRLAKQTPSLSCLLLLLQVAEDPAALPAAQPVALQDGQEASLQLRLERAEHNLTFLFQEITDSAYAAEQCKDCKVFVICNMDFMEVINAHTLGRSLGRPHDWCKLCIDSGPEVTCHASKTCRTCRDKGLTSHKRTGKSPAVTPAAKKTRTK